MRAFFVETRRAFVEESFCNRVEYGNFARSITEKAVTMKKRLFVLLSAAVLFGVARADVFPFLTFDSSDGSALSVDVASVVMTYSDGKLMVSSGGVSQQLDVAGLDSMYFSSDDLTLINDVSQEEASGAKTLYTVAGVRVGEFSGSLDGRVSPGLYIVRQGRRTSKIVVR